MYPEYVEIDLDPYLVSSQRLGTTHAYVLDEGWGALCYAMRVPAYAESPHPKMGDVTKIRDKENHYVGCQTCNAILHGELDREEVADGD